MAMPADWKPPISEQNDFNSEVDFGPEREIWRNEVMTGIIHRHVAEVQVITNQRVVLNDRAILFKDLDDIVVMNQHRESQGQSTRYYVRGFGTSYGTGRTSGKSIGDLIFMYRGQTSIIFRQITDPNGVAKLAKAARRSMISIFKAVFW